MERWFEYLTMTAGGILGWFVGEFSPAFPLIIIATIVSMIILPIAFPFYPA